MPSLPAVGRLGRHGEGVPVPGGVQEAPPARGAARPRLEPVSERQGSVEARGFQDRGPGSGLEDGGPSEGPTTPRPL